MTVRVLLGMLRLPVQLARRLDVSSLRHLRTARAEAAQRGHWAIEDLLRVSAESHQQRHDTERWLRRVGSRFVAPVDKLRDEPHAKWIQLGKIDSTLQVSNVSSSCKAEVAASIQQIPYARS